jgi:hypothetical protein
MYEALIPEKETRCVSGEWWKASTGLTPNSIPPAASEPGQVALVSRTGPARVLLVFIAPRRERYLSNYVGNLASMPEHPFLYDMPPWPDRVPRAQSITFISPEQ